MPLFILASVVLVLICLISLAPVLLNRRRLNEIDIEEENLRLAEFRFNQIADNSEDRIALEASLIDDLKAPKYQPKRERTSGKFFAASFFILIPVTAALIYIKLGSPFWIDPDLPTSAEIEQNPEANITLLVTRLEQTLQENPDNADGWALAGRTYMSLGRFNDAEQAYQRVHQIVGDDPDILTAWADASLMVNGNVYSREISQRIHRALELNPTQVNALWIAAMGARSQNNFEQSIEYLTRLKPLISESPDAIAQVDQLIQELQPEGTQGSSSQSTNETNNASIAVTVSIDEGLIADLPSNTPVFVFARAVSGPPFPLAAQRLLLSQLPITITLDESMAMLPDNHLGTVTEAIVIARVSLSGQPTATPGDLTSTPVKSATKTGENVEVKINQKVE